MRVNIRNTICVIMMCLIFPEGGVAHYCGQKVDVQILKLMTKHMYNSSLRLEATSANIQTMG